MDPVTLINRVAMNFTMRANWPFFAVDPFTRLVYWSRISFGHECCNFMNQRSNINLLLMLLLNYQ
jgi:hypothetical protein